MVGKLSDADRQGALEGLRDWTYEPEDEAIVCHFEFEDFSQAFGFMARVALLAESAGHHPDWFNSYGDVTISLSTHDAGGLSQKDIDLAQKIDALLA